MEDADSGVKNLMDNWLCGDFQASTMSLSGLDPGKLLGQDLRMKVLCKYRK